MLAFLLILVIKGARMIPKIIHFCWFGNNKYPFIVEKCLKSIFSVLSDYEIKIWNEESFNVNHYAFTKKAYAERKWAFVADYVRLKVLFEYGGIYLDSDVEVLKDFYPLIRKEKIYFSRIEGGLVSCGFIAVEPHNTIIKELIDYYDSVASLDDETMNYTMNPLIYTIYLKQKFGLMIGYESFETDKLMIYPLHFLMPFRKSFFGKKNKKYNHSKYLLKNETFCIHHDLGSWSTESPFSRFVKNVIRLVVPSSFYLWLKKKRFETTIKRIESIYHF